MKPSELTARATTSATVSDPARQSACGKDCSACPKALSCPLSLLFVPKGPDGRA